jgi:hypothetical protein
LGSNSNYNKQEFDRNGNLLRSTFYPSADMLRFAMARASLKNNSLSDQEIMESLGMSGRQLKRWREGDDARDFEDWLVKCIENFQAPVKEALFAFGVDRAFQGDFSFWREVSRSVGAITSEKIEVTSTYRPIEDLEKLTPEQLALEQERLIAELTGTRTNKVAQSPAPEGPPGSEPGDSPLQEGSLALPD